MPGPSKVNETNNIPRGAPNMGRLIPHGDSITGLMQACTIQELLALVGGVAPVTTFTTEAEMLANTTLGVGYLAYVADTNTIYLYQGPNPADLDSYVFFSHGKSFATGEFKFDLDTTATDPTDGYLKLNTASYATVTEIYISSLTQDEVDIGAVLGALATNDEIRIQLKSNDDDNVLFGLTEPATDNSGWWTLKVINISAGGALFADEAEIIATAIIQGSGAGGGGSLSVESVGEGLGYEDAQVKLGSATYPTLNPIVVNRFIELADTKALQILDGSSNALLTLKADATNGHSVVLQAIKPSTGELMMFSLGMGAPWSGAKFTDLRTTAKGIEYAADYGSNYTARSLIDKANAQALIAAAIALIPPPPVVVDANEAQKGVVEESTDAQTQAGTATGETGAKLFITPAKNATWWTWVKTLVQTFAAQITFTSAPKFSSTTANEFLKVDGSKDLISIAPAGTSDLITGTDNTKPLTASALTGYRSLAEIAAVVAAGTLNLNFGTLVEALFNVSTTITGNCTITVTSTNGKIFLLQFAVTGTVAITMPSSFKFEIGDTSLGRWNAGTKILTLTGATDTEYEIIGVKRGSVWRCMASKYD